MYVLFFFVVNGKNTKKSKRQSLYTIELSSASDAIRGHEGDDALPYLNRSDFRGIMEMSPKPMTPRRVKRRSVMTRGTNSRQSSSSRRMNSNNRSSIRNSKRKYTHQNPVTKILEDQQLNSQPEYTNYMLSPPLIPLNSKSEPSALTITNLQSLNKDYGDVISANKVAAYKQITVNPDPIYYNMNSSSPLIEQSWNSRKSADVSNNFHVNSSYQHSTPNLSHSPEPDEPYHRPPSVRSSYSNFHGSRPLSSHVTSTKSENVFVNLADQNVAQAIPQVPHRLHTSTTISMKTNSSQIVSADKAFFKNGPPAYNLNYHTPPDSETTM